MRNPRGALLSGFNPRPREGATGPAEIHIRRTIVSIHAPVKGRPLDAHPWVWMQAFQSTPP